MTAGLPSVGLRIPAHPMARALLEAAQIPIAAPSANRFTELSPTTAEHVRGRPRVDMILDGGPCTVGIESTVISLAGPTPRILRPGMISADADRTDASDRSKSAPEPNRRASIRATTVHARRSFSAITPAEGRGRASRLRPDAARCRLHTPSASIAFSTNSTEQGYDWISIELPPDTPEWAGIRDRLIRAANR